MKQDTEQLLNLDETCGDDLLMFDEICEDEELTIISAMSKVLDEASKSKLSKSFWEESKEALAFLREQLGLTDIQIIFITAMMETGKIMNWTEFSKFLNCSRLSLMSYTEEVEQLVDKRWVYRKKMNHYCDEDGFVLMDGVATALSHNQTFVPEKIDGLTIQEFVDKMEKHLAKKVESYNNDFSEDEKWMEMMCKANQHLPLCREVMRLEEDNHIRSLLLLAVYDYAQWAGSEYEGVTIEMIKKVYEEEVCCVDAVWICQTLQDGDHPLIREGLLEPRYDNGMADDDRFVLTRRSKEGLLEGYIPSRTKCLSMRQNKRCVKKSTSIREKHMFYNPSEQEQIAMLTNMLSQESLPAIQQRLCETGLRKGFACLFYGEPGTGKTETVLQLARQTGRDILEVNIAGMRDKYVGETEKNVKSVFMRYRSICKQSEVMPILFFNEADAIFGKRTEIGDNPVVEKMENAMQNIILQEMEDLEGILIATTNLTKNLDDAFERRVLFKVEFHQPDTDVKTKLWKSMLGDDITEEEAHMLAGRYEFSGGQIENIARKRSIDYVLYGKRCTLETLDTYCRNELLAKKKAHAPVGFRI